MTNITSMNLLRFYLILGYNIYYNEYYDSVYVYIYTHTSYISCAEEQVLILF